jgi:hypothetical protein
LWYDTDDGTLYTADGSTWSSVGVGAIANVIDDNFEALTHNAEASAAGTTYSKVKTITLSMPLGTDTIRVKLDYKGVPFNDGYVRIYKNGVAFGTERQGTTSYQSVSEDLEFSDGDTLEVWAKGRTDGGGGTGYVKNLKVMGYGVLAMNIGGANS